MRRAYCLLLLLIAPMSLQAGEKQAAPKTKNVIIVTLDGFRFQEFFGGADEQLMNKEFGGVKDKAGLLKRYWRDTPEERRAALLPFFWNEIAKKGQIFGDRSKKATTK